MASPMHRQEGCMAKKVQELKVWQRAQELCVAVDAILDRPVFGRSPRLREQLEAAADSIVANIAEGFEQPTDRAFVRYLYTAKASTAEVRTRLRRACDRGYISASECAQRDALGDEVSRLVNGLIKYLCRSDRKDRGLPRPGGRGTDN
jgi:four helix bundle protein